MTQSGSELDRTKAAAVGAPGWISKTLGRGQLLEAVRSVVYKTGQPLPSPASGGARRAWDSATWSEGTVEHVQRLSHQEKRMLPMVAEGKTNKEIARTLGLSDKTVKNYLANVFSKLGVRRRSQVAALYVQGAVTVGETRGWDSSVIGG
ncbi:MAG: response regulator transcription factor [Nitrospiraceae bacterium]